jgi:hypothetical protein
MRRGLTNPANDGFLREDALLAVIIVSDEDDCSAYDGGIFDPTQTDISDPLGPLSSFRCFEFGIVCDGDDPRTPGAKSECASRDASAYVTPVQDYVDFLHGLKYDSSMVVVAGIFGDSDDVAVGTDDNGNPQLQASCSSAGGVAFPGVRLQQFLDGFPERNRFASICEDDLGGPLADAAMAIRDTALRSPCLHGQLRDVQLERSGLQPQCRVYDQLALDGGMVQRNEIRPCSDGVLGPCFEINEDTQTCGHTESGLAVAIQRSDAAPAGSHTIVECLTP